MKETDVAIIGMSCIFPGAENMDAFWKNLIHGIDSTSQVPENRIDSVFFQEGESAVDRFYCDRGGFIPEVSFDALKFGVLPLTVEGMEPDHLITLQLAYQALEDAAVFKKNKPLSNTAIIIGKGNYAGPAATRAIEIVRTGEQIAQLVREILPDASADDVAKIKQAYQAQKGRFKADTVSGLIPNIVASLVANKLNLGGAAYTIDAACASSLIAVDHAVKELLSGRSDMVIAGGVHVGQNAAFWSIFSQLGALSHKKRVTTFSTDTDGLLIGEGCGFVVLKKLSAAIADGDRIYALIKGVGVSSDGNATSVMNPSSAGQLRAIKEAWQKAEICPEQIRYIETHGTGTVVGDKTELETLTAAFGNHQSMSEVLIGSVKTNIGHAMPAAGIAGLIKTSLALYHRRIPPTLYARNPMPQLLQTQFRLAEQLTEWDTEKQGVAGVNAFGFGGINAHVVLEAYPKKQEVPVTPSCEMEDVLVVAAQTQSRLLEILESRDFRNHTTGAYRLVLFNPTDDRIEKAKNIVSKGSSWKGRLDIWFSNAPLLNESTKVAFLYPGLDALSLPETRSIEEYFSISIPGNEQEDPTSVLSRALNLYRSTEIINTAFRQLGIEADACAGHSMGEWLALNASGMLEKSSVTHLLKSLRPETFEIGDAYFIAVGCGVDKVDKYLKSIPDLYLSNDNCPNQTILCGKSASISILTEELKQEQVFFQILPFQSGFHTPFIADKLSTMLGNMDQIALHEDSIPTWSATTLTPYPYSLSELKELTLKHLTEPVRFRELILKLHENSVRVFIQIGSGGLVGFIDDTLKKKTYSAVASNVASRSGLEQLRRVLALLFIEGKYIDTPLLRIEKSTEPKGQAIGLNLGLPIVKDFTYLKGVTRKYVSATNGLSDEQADTCKNHPVYRAMHENLEAIKAMQADMSKLFGQQYTPYTGSGNTPQVPAITSPVVPVIHERTFQKEIHISLDNHPYLVDHSLVKQPAGWPDIEDSDPVIPMTMIFECLAETAHERCPELRVQRIREVSVYQWMKVFTPFIQLIKGSRTDEQTIHTEISNFVKADIVLGQAYLPESSANTPSPGLGKVVLPPLTPEQIYAQYMFHGPLYQGIVEVNEVCEKGIRGHIRANKGKGSLLDNAGQLFGLWLQLTLTKNRIAFPVKIEDISFFGSMYDQDGVFECTCVIKELNEEYAFGDIILRKDGKVWCKITNWQNRRLEIDEALWRITLSPRVNLMSEEIAANAFFFYNAYTKVTSWYFVQKRYFGKQEKERIEGLSINKQKTHIVSRIAAKDAVRAYMARNFDRYAYPIEFSIQSDEQGRPLVSGLTGIPPIFISIAHKGTDAVAIASDKPVGIDIEAIEPRSDDFIGIAFTEGERRLIAGRDLAVWTTRLWVAKEAYGKMQGTGLMGNPQRYEVSEIEDDTLIINNVKIKTINHKNYIVGWTM